MQSPADDRMLDEIVDLALRAVTEGRELDLDTLCSARPDLRARAEALVELVRETAPWGGTEVPEVGGYRILRQIGRGGMGTVFLAEQLALRRRIALKLLPAASALSVPARQRFRNEARALAAVRHPHVVEVYEIIETPTLCAYAMEWVEGTNLAEALEERTFSVQEVATLGVSLADALAAVHDAGIVHRDVKPSNVLLRTDGSAVLSDFGLARDSSSESLTVTGAFVGTKAFAAPEQVRGEWDSVGERSDVYSLGATLAAALCGRGVPADLATILATATAEDPEDRYVSARALAEDLERFLKERPILARPTPLLTRARKLAKRNRKALGLALLASCGVLVVAVLFGLHFWSASTRPERCAAELVRARLLLLEPTHEERLERAALGAGARHPTRFATNATSALRHYDAAVELGAGAEIEAEREVVATALALARRAEPAASPRLTELCPRTAAALLAARRGTKLSPADAEGASPLDRRLLGLFGFLTGDVLGAHAAWQRAGLDEDPFLAAATGQLLRSELEYARALPRFLCAARAFPSARFLEIALAECLLEVGEVREASKLLREVDEAVADDPFRIALRLRARILAAQGRNREARSLFERALREHSSTRTRIDFARCLAAEGDLETASAHASEAGGAEDAHPKDRAACREIAVRWWQGRGFGAAQRELALALHVLDPRQTRVGRIARILAATPTLAGAASSQASMPAQSARALASLEILKMKSLFPRGFSARTSRVLAGAALALSERHGRALPLLALALASGLAVRTPAQASWVQRSPATQPPARMYLMMAHDTTRGRSVLFGGQSCYSCAYLGDTWEWNGTTWAQVATTGPSPRSLFAITFDSLRNRTILFGGSTSTGNSAETWSWDGTTWTQLTPTSSPPGRSSFDMCYDSARDRIVLFGGGSVADTWEWDGTTWTQRLPATKPSARDGHRMVYDSVRKRVVLFGGRLGGSIYQDTWEWDGTNWQQIATPSTPAARFVHMMAYDSARARTVLYGGWTGAPLSDTWDYDGVTWTLRSGPAPAARNGGAFAFDANRGRIVLFAGDPGNVPYRDTWEFATPKPASVTPFGTACPSSVGPAAMGTTAPAPLPYLGDTFSVVMQPIPNGFFNQPFFLLGNSDQFWDTTPLPLPLDALGMPTCKLLTNPLVTIAGGRSGSTGTLALAIPNVTSFAGSTLYLQGGVVDAAANPLGIAMANGLRFQLGIR